MGQVNDGLIVLAFSLGLLLTLGLTIRRVKREVPVRSSTGTDADATEEDSAG